MSTGGVVGNGQWCIEQTVPDSLPAAGCAALAAHAAMSQHSSPRDPPPDPHLPHLSLPTPAPLPLPGTCACTTWLSASCCAASRSPTTSRWMECWTSSTPSEDRGRGCCSPAVQPRIAAAPAAAVLSLLCRVCRMRACHASLPSCNLAAALHSTTLSFRTLQVHDGCGTAGPDPGRGQRFR